MVSTLIETWKNLHAQWEENRLLLELARDENNETAAAEVGDSLDKIVQAVLDVEFRHMLNEEHDI